MLLAPDQMRPADADRQQYNLLTPNRPDNMDVLSGGGLSRSRQTPQDVSVVNTAGKIGLLDTPFGELSVEGLTEAALNMGSMPFGSIAMGLEGLMSEHLGPYGVVGAPVAPQVNTPMFDAVVDAGRQASMMSDKDLSPQARFGMKQAPTPPGFMSMPSFSDTFGNMFGGQQPSFGGVMGNVQGGGRGYGDVGRDASGDGMGGYGGPEGVGRDNDRGGGIGF